MDIAKILSTAKLHKKNIYLANYQDRQYTIQLDDRQQLHSIAYFDELENKVQMIFHKMKYKKGILAPVLLECKYPRDYDMIRG
ncbi:Outer-membrane lipoprotein carrier protein precursor [hydrothermal vent metagenome]|uniref:Outer-membrane lipoprotein carrier protein n=1 Tax=hydrothermal vent metagenome TaxID=652676 RepID=A0A1W1BG29_9ZZZZ